jgi:thiamine biosynthesis lipoprotein
LRLPLAALGFALAVLATSCGGPVHVNEPTAALGVDGSIELHTGSGSAARRTVDEIGSAFTRAAGILTLEPRSELVVLNREAAAAPYGVRDADLYRCVRIALEWARATDGAFDPTVGTPGVGWREVSLYPEAQALRFKVEGLQLDLGGIAEGYALDMAARSFARSGVRSALLGLGGVRYAWRAPAGRDHWTVPLIDPAYPDRLLGSVDVEHRGVGFAGSLTPLLEPESPVGSPESDVLAAVAIADTGAASAAIARALVVMGSGRAGALLERTRRVEVLLLVRGARGDSLVASASLEGRLAVEPDLLARVGGAVRHLLPPETYP